MQQVESKNCVINSKKRGKAVFTMPIYRPRSCRYTGKFQMKVDCMIKIWTVKDRKTILFIRQNSLLVCNLHAHDLVHNFTGNFYARLALCLFNRQCLYYVRDFCLSL